MDFNEIMKRGDVFLAEQYDAGVSHIVLPGTIPVMFSAPHAVGQLRKGREKMAESYTGVLVELLHEKTNAHAIIKQRNKKDDANYDDFSPYREELIAYIQSNDIQLLIDLHIMKESNPHDIEMATGNGENILQDWTIIEKITELAKVHGLQKVVTDVNFFALNPNCIAAHIATSCKIPAIQLEINWRQLKTEQNFIRMFNYFEKLCSNFKG